MAKPEVQPERPLGDPISIVVTEDGLRAELVLCTVGAGARSAERSQIDACIQGAGVCFGVDPTAIEAAWDVFQKQGVAHRCIATGTPAQRGVDAHLELEIDLERTAGVATGQRIDYRERLGVKNVRRGQHIGTWCPATAGVEGRTVCDEVLEAEPGENGSPSIGEGVSGQPPVDGRIPYLATQDGALLIRADGTFCVVDLFEVSGDVDFDLGNIDVIGSVKVGGTVRSRFRVTASGDIAVMDSIEDAEIRAGGSFAVCGGILGGDWGSVHARAQVWAEYAQNARILAGQDVELGDSDTGSDISCRGKILAMQGKGRLRGGRYAALVAVHARELGSKWEVLTRVTVGGDPVLERELAQVRRELSKAQEKCRKIQRYCAGVSAKHVGGNLDAQKALAVRKCMRARRAGQVAVNRLLDRKKRLERMVGYGGVVEVSGTVHAGVEIEIHDARMEVTQSMDNVRFEYDPEERRIRVASRQPKATK